MTMNKFWEFIISLESEYGSYRKKIMNRFSLSAAETDILMFLSNNPQYDTGTDISRIRKIPKSQVSTSVKSLCEKGYLCTDYKENNRKSIHLSLTTSALSVTDYGKTVQAEFADLLFSGFSEEEKSEFERLHIKIADNIASKKEL